MVPVQVTVSQQGGEPVIYNGSLDLVDNIEQTTSIQGPGRLRVRKGYVLPGLYVSVRVRLRTIEAVMVPDEATSATPTSQYVYVVDSKQVLQRRMVVTAALYDGLRHVTSGLKAGDVVVVKGNPVLVRQGAKVKPDVVDARAFVAKEQKAEQSAIDESSGTSEAGKDTKADADGSGDGS